jgi:hypothetical protein
MTTTTGHVFTANGPSGFSECSCGEQFASGTNGWTPTDGFNEHVTEVQTS